MKATITTAGTIGSTIVNSAHEVKLEVKGATIYIKRTPEGWQIEGHLDAPPNTWGKVLIPDRRAE
jgi:hypothetical protein